MPLLIYPQEGNGSVNLTIRGLITVNLTMRVNICVHLTIRRLISVLSYR